jgi:hypothetical protein
VSEEGYVSQPWSQSSHDDHHHNGRAHATLGSSGSLVLQVLLLRTSTSTLNLERGCFYYLSLTS